MKFFTAQLPGTLRVDRTARRINGVALATLGEANGDKFDDETLAALVRLANESNVRARFNHPNRSNAAEIEQDLNCLLGQHVNPRIDGNVCRVDTQMIGVNVELEDKVMDLAEKAPHLFGLSVVIDDPPPPGKKAKKGDPCRPIALFAADFVDIPASNNAGLFAATAAGKSDPMDPADIYAKDGKLFCMHEGKEVPLNHTPESLDASHDMWKAGRKKEGKEADDGDDMDEESMKKKAKTMGFVLAKIETTDPENPLALTQADVDAAAVKAVEKERAYRKAFSTIVGEAKMDQATATEFEESFYGQDEKTLKFFASKVLGTRAKPIGEGSGAHESQQRQPDEVEAKLKEVEASAGKAFDETPQVRRMYSCIVNDPNSDQWKTARGRHVAAARRLAASQSK